MEESTLRLFLCGDVMTGRGIDQILPNPVEPRLYERSVQDARQYVALAEAENGKIDYPVNYEYIWGEALSVFQQQSPDYKIVNLETAVTTSDEPWPRKAVHYRMHPENARCLSAADIDIVSLANNHVLDWGRPGLLETLETLESLGVQTCGAGRDLAGAQRPAIIDIDGGGRLLVFAAGSTSSGIPAEWEAEKDLPGVFMVTERSKASIDRLTGLIGDYRQPEDLVVVSIHWGSNWGYQVPSEQRRLAQQLIDRSGVSLVHGHSSHHVKGLEAYQGGLILYGCGDFLTDYEGIKGYDEYRDDLGLMYFAELNMADGELTDLTMVPSRLKNMQIQSPSAREVAWLTDLMNREADRFGVQVVSDGSNALRLQLD